ncbi:WDR5 [Branchiostoma lanceolatum]|uniref:WDR5 protein n=1 Tax=Branchiostoma lanceolatum TaxID=7740 RepID=A0A8J9VKA4_BRALA|nr:WDR5 [Branchiostoma lanceolatum]
MDARGGGTMMSPPQRFFYMPRFQYNQNQTYHGYYRRFQPRMHAPDTRDGVTFDGKRMRKSIQRKTIDYNPSCIQHLETRIWQRDMRDVRPPQPDGAYGLQLVPPMAMMEQPMNAVTTKFVRTSTNKIRCPIFVVRWTPEGRRLVTGASSGEFTLWNGLAFNFETILQAHDTAVRAMSWSHNDQWMVTADHAGFVKYWQSNMNNVKMFQAHKEAVREVSFCPTDNKFATCSDDSTVRIWDFMRCHEERILRGHGADVKTVDWHPQKGLLASGSKDSQQPIKIWDPKSGQSLATLHAHKSTVMEVKFNQNRNWLHTAHAHKSTVMEVKFNQNGNWLLTASRDHLVKVFDIRTMREMQSFRGHKKEATAIAWHPIHESLFASGGSEGSILFWQVGNDKEVGGMENAHEGMIWSLAWHPLGHILCSGSNDHSTKFWSRNRPGDQMKDRYNLNLPIGSGGEDGMEEMETAEAPSSAAIPGMGLEHGLPEHLKKPEEPKEEAADVSIPGLDFSTEEMKILEMRRMPQKKVPYSKPIPAQFQEQWEKEKPTLPTLLSQAQDKGKAGGEKPMTSAPSGEQAKNNAQMHQEMMKMRFTNPATLEAIANATNQPPGPRGPNPMNQQQGPRMGQQRFGPPMGFGQGPQPGMNRPMGPRHMGPNQGPPGHMMGPGNQGRPGHMGGPRGPGPGHMGGPGGPPGRMGPPGNMDGPPNQGPHMNRMPNKGPPPRQMGPPNQGPHGPRGPGNQGPPGPMGGPPRHMGPGNRGPRNQGPPEQAQMSDSPRGDGANLPPNAPRGLPNPGPGLLGAPPPPMQSLMGRDADKQTQGGDRFEGPPHHHRGEEEEFYDESYEEFPGQEHPPFDHRGPPRGQQGQRGRPHPDGRGPPRGQRGPPEERGPPDRRGPPGDMPGEFQGRPDQSGPPEDFRGQGGPMQDPRGPPGERDNRGPQRWPEGRRGPPGDHRAPRGEGERGPPRGNMEQRGPPRGERDQRGPPRGDLEQPGPPRGNMDQRGPPGRHEEEHRREDFRGQGEEFHEPPQSPREGWGEQEPWHEDPRGPPQDRRGHSAEFRDHREGPWEEQDHRRGRGRQNDRGRGFRAEGRDESPPVPSEEFHEHERFGGDGGEFRRREEQRGGFRGGRGGGRGVPPEPGPGDRKEGLLPTPLGRGQGMARGRGGMHSPRQDGRGFEGPADRERRGSHEEMRSPSGREERSSLHEMDVARLPPRKRPWRDETQEQPEHEAMGPPPGGRGGRPQGRGAKAPRYDEGPHEDPGGFRGPDLPPSRGRGRGERGGRGRGGGAERGSRGGRGRGRGRGR